MLKKSRGNSLMEYVLPMGILLIGAGIITTAMIDLPEVMGEYFAKASGSQVSGTRVIADKMSQGAAGSLGTGGNFTSFGGGSASSGGSGSSGNGGGASGGASSVYYSPGGRSGERQSVMGGNGGDLTAFRRISPNISKALSKAPADSSADYKGAVYGDAGVADAKAALVSKGTSAQQLAMMDAALLRARSEVTRAAVADDLGRLQGGDWSGVTTVINNTDNAMANDSKSKALKAAAKNMRCTFEGCSQTDYASMMAGKLVSMDLEATWKLSCSEGSDSCDVGAKQAMAEEAVSKALGVSVMSEASYKPWEIAEVKALTEITKAQAAANPTITEVPPPETP